MKYYCIFKGVELTDRVKREVEARLGHMERHLRNFQPAVFHASVAVERPARGGQYNARLALNILKHVLVARRPGPTAEAAVDRASVEVERQLERYKSRLRQDYRHKRKRTGLSARPSRTA
jgi:ribosomal subunit interface protein